MRANEFKNLLTQLNELPSTTYDPLSKGELITALYNCSKRLVRMQVDVQQLLIDERQRLGYVPGLAELDSVLPADTELTKRLLTILERSDSNTGEIKR